MQRRLRIYADALALSCSLLTALLLHAGCLYVPVRVTHAVPAEAFGDAGKDTALAAGMKERMYEKKYFARAFGFSSAVRANNSGVDMAVRGDFPQAIALFREAIGIEASRAEPYNNCAIIYELTGHREEAYEMYMKACLLDPDNTIYRGNFLYFNDTKK